MLSYIKNVENMYIKKVENVPLVLFVWGTHLTVFRAYSLLLTFTPGQIRDHIQQQRSN